MVWMHTRLCPPLILEIRIIVMTTRGLLAGSISAALLTAQVVGNGNYARADLLGHLGRGGNCADLRFDFNFVTILDTTGCRGLGVNPTRIVVVEFGQPLAVGAP